MRGLYDDLPDRCHRRAIYRRCSPLYLYLTIELEGAIPEKLRPLMGNRIYGCDDCQLICPWNRYSQLTTEDDFSPRKPLHAPELIELFAWSEEKFLKVTEGLAIRRIGHLRWLRNIAVALGNAPWDETILAALESRKGEHPLLDEHIARAIAQQIERRNACIVEVQLPKKTASGSGDRKRVTGATPDPSTACE